MTDTLLSSGFVGKILGFSPSNSSLQIENAGVIKTAVPTSLEVSIQCFPLPGHDDTCPHTIAVAVPATDRGDAAFNAEVPRSLTANGNGTVYTLEIPVKRA